MFKNSVFAIIIGPICSSIEPACVYEFNINNVNVQDLVRVRRPAPMYALFFRKLFVEHRGLQFEFSSSSSSC